MLRASHLAVATENNTTAPHTEQKHGLVRLGARHVSDRGRLTLDVRTCLASASREPAVTRRERKSAPRKLNTPQITLGHFRVYTKRPRNGVAFRNQLQRRRPRCTSIEEGPMASGGKDLSSVGWSVFRTASALATAPISGVQMRMNGPSVMKSVSRVTP